ncbi:DNA polymerase I [Thermoleptolyngbya sp. C42_A2020_037]|uniref:DNA polymerase I n=1 Tax=Thermoleptolyngbya sp. C42_A2020_037 TaxID=2747799 RepID=UPI0019F2FB80|nr:DNA polymerase I [Thermoleptolyngbya sp. C42_A2020_037]MBF2084311.1 DNA polymerase I [Thermoleptolyngbya sp. C42_A2020_037]
MPTLLLVDGHSLAFRSYYAHAKNRDGGLRTKTGIPTSVSFGFMKALLDTMEQEKPDYVAIAFDPGEPTYRHEADQTYKEGRPDAPEDFLPDLSNLQELLQALKLPVIAVPGYEADDVIGTLSRKAVADGFRVKVLTGDRDLFQLIDDEQLTVLYLSTTFGKGTPPPREFGPQQVKDKMGITPQQVVDYKALCGDASDNIPGVKGIGDKTAVSLLTDFGSLAEIYSHLDDPRIKSAVRKKLEEGRDAALHSQYLAQIHLDVPLALRPEDCKLQAFDDADVVPLLEKLEFRSFLNRLQKLHSQFSGDGATQQPSAPNAAPALQHSSTPAPSEDDDLWFFSAEDTATFQGYATTPVQPQIIDTPDKLSALVNTLQTCTDPAAPVAWDTETTALEPRDAVLVGIGCCWGPGEADVAYIPTGHAQGTNLDVAIVLEALRPILESADYPKALQNAKFDRLVLRCQGIHLAGVVFDTMLASYVLNPEGSHNLTDLGRKYLNLNAQSYDDLVPKGKTIADVSIPKVANYCGTDVYSVFHLVPQLRAELAQIPRQTELLETVEQPLEPVLAEMEYTGVRIDQDYLKAFSKALEQDLKRIEEQAYEAAGQTFNLGSPKQLSVLLFDTLGLDKRKSKKRATGYSTDASTLEKLQGDHPVVDLIQEHRTLSKLKSTYVDALPSLVRPDTQRVHTDFNQTVTATGRLSSSNPNLQNIPIRTEFSRQIRKAFIPAEGWLLVAADYSQIELRILAHLSGEPILIETYQNNGDVHTVTAQLLFEKEDITPDERRMAKTINFGVIYGMGAQRFARESGFSQAQAKTFIDRFYERYSRVFGYLQQMQQEAIARGYVETILGRRRYFNFGSESLKALRGQNPSDIDINKIRLRDQYDAQLLRAAANAPIQGSSADIIKLAMIRLHNLLTDRRANLLLQVHDELVFEVHPDEWDDLQPQIRAAMESAVDLKVPLKVEMHAGQNWMEAK